MIPMDLHADFQQPAGTPILSINSALDIEAKQVHRSSSPGNFVSPPGEKDATSVTRGGNRVAGQGYVVSNHQRPIPHHTASYSYSGMRHHNADFHHHPHAGMYGYHPDMYYQHHMAMQSGHAYSNPHPMYYMPPPYDKERLSHSETWKIDKNRGNVPSKDYIREESVPSEKKLAPSPRAKATPLLRSPPPKKRKFVTSWEDPERDDYVGAASPGIFCSPLPNSLMPHADIGVFDFRRSPGLDISTTPGKFDLNDPNLRIDTPGRHVKIDDSLFGKSFDELDHDDDDELLKGIDTNQRLSASPKMSFDKNNECDDGTNPPFNLSPIGSHDFSPFPGRDIIEETVKSDHDDNPDEHFPFKKFGASPFSLKHRNRSAMPLPTLSKDDNERIPPTRQNQSPSIHVLGFHSQQNSYMRAHFGSPLGFRMEMGFPHGTQSNEPTVESQKVKTSHDRTSQTVIQTPAKNHIPVQSTPASMPKPSPYPGTGARQVHYQMPVPRSNVKTPLSVASAPMSTPRKPVQPSSTQKKSPQLQRRQPCNCKKSKCLKLYCECFAAQIVCSGCNCIDCHNTPNHEDIRSKAIKDTKLKNSSAFKPKATTVNNGHITGCKCKKSKCLKKYCECFESGYVCGTKCKCSDCQNFPGSKLLLERRKKIKDHKGVEDAIRQQNKNDVLVTSVNRHAPNQMYPPSSTPIMMQHGMTMMMNSPNFMPPRGPMMLPPGTMFSPSPAYHGYYAHSMPKPQIPHEMKKYPNILVSKNPKTPSRRDPLKSNSNKIGEVILKEFFGPKNGLQEKRAVIGIFSFLSNEELYNASIVSKAWSKIATDDELWTFEV